jgi:hypothetical protein
VTVAQVGYRLPDDADDHSDNNDLSGNDSMSSRSG